MEDLFALDKSHVLGAASHLKCQGLAKLGQGMKRGAARQELEAGQLPSVQSQGRVRFLRT